MIWVRRFVTFLAACQAGFMVFDGLHALTLGDYLVPIQGPSAHGGQLWANIVQGAGIAPNSLMMKSIFIGYGLLWLSIVWTFARGFRWGRALMILAAIGSLWHLGAGTPIALMQIILLVLLPSRPRPLPANM
jgi:hypothetical protein